MTYDNYILYLQGSAELYPSKTKKYIMKLFVDAGVAQNTQQMSIDNIVESSIDVNDLKLSEKIKMCLQKHKKAVSMFEKWEFEKDYKYSIVFQTDNFDELLTKIELIDSYINLEKDESSIMSDIIEFPIKFSIDNLDIIKFNLKFAVVDPLTEKELFLKYPVLVVIHKEEKLIEFRFDALKRVFISEKRELTIYADLISDLSNYFLNKLDCVLEPLDLDFIIKEAKKEDQDEVRVMAEYRKLPSGGNAQLEVGSNEQFVLPIIGDLKEVLQQYRSELEKVPTLKDALDQFIFENDELSDYHWIEVMWENELKTRNNRVKFIFNYKNNTYCLIQHYYNNVLIGMERMNHVIKYLNRHKDFIKF